MKFQAAAAMMPILLQLQKVVRVILMMGQVLQNPQPFLALRLEAALKLINKRMEASHQVIYLPKIFLNFAIKGVLSQS